MPVSETSITPACLAIKTVAGQNTVSCIRKICGSDVSLIHFRLLIFHGRSPGESRVDFISSMCIYSINLNRAV